MALFGSKKHDDHDGSEAGASSSGVPDHREPDENTRLLQSRPPPPHSDGYLDPDDPAVSIHTSTITWRISDHLHLPRFHRTIYGLSDSYVTLLSYSS
jgi:hypothetical protein